MAEFEGCPPTEVLFSKAALQGYKTTSSMTNHKLALLHCIKIDLHTKAKVKTVKSRGGLPHLKGTQEKSLHMLSESGNAFESLGRCACHKNTKVRQPRTAVPRSTIPRVSRARALRPNPFFLCYGQHPKTQTFM